MVGEVVQSARGTPGSARALRQSSRDTPAPAPRHRRARAFGPAFRARSISATSSARGTSRRANFRVPVFARIRAAPPGPDVMLQVAGQVERQRAAAFASPGLPSRSAARQDTPRALAGGPGDPGRGWRPHRGETGTRHMTSARAAAADDEARRRGARVREAARDGTGVVIELQNSLTEPSSDAWIAPALRLTASGRHRRRARSALAARGGGRPPERTAARRPRRSRTRGSCRR